MLGPDDYRPDARDRLWLQRAVQGEGPPHELVAQALVNRFMWLRSRRPSYPTLAEFVQAYSQPVNPRWLVGGDKHEAAMAKATSDERRRELLARTRRRERIRSLTQFDPEVERAVQRALASGPLDLPTLDTTDFAHARLALASHLEETGVAGAQRFSRVRGSDWGGYTVRTESTLVAVAGMLVIVAAVTLSRRS